MANTNAPRGFSPVSNNAGNPWNEQATLYYIPSSDTNAYYIGDAVKSAAGADANGVSQVAKITSGNEATTAIRGIIVGVRVADPGVSLQGKTLDLASLAVPATKARDYYVYVVDDPAVIFEIQDDGTTFPTSAAACANKNVSYNVAAPSGISPLSASTLAASTAATTNTLPLKIMGFVQRVDNDMSSAYRKVLVKINNHELQGGIAGV